MNRRICVVTSSRADYGHLYWLMKSVQDDPRLVLQVLVTGAHLSKRFGLTHKIIEEDGFPVTVKVPVPLYGGDEAGMLRTIGRGCFVFADTFRELRPDVVVVFGDRFEMFAACLAAHMMRIPIAHLHGGETSQGAVDEALRHSMTKLSHIHFAATEIYRNRIIQLGEDPKYVYNFGAPGLDVLKRVKLLSKTELGNVLKIASFQQPMAIVTYHPLTLCKDGGSVAADHLLKALKQLNIRCVFTQSNADVFGKIINQKFMDFCGRYPERFKFIKTLGTVNYLSCLKHFDLMIGNSSSGLIEAPSFGLPVVNIGDRQRGRIKAANVIDVGESLSEIKKGIQKALSKSFINKARQARNPYVRFNDGKISERIKEALKGLQINDKFLFKKFHDLKFAHG